MNAQRTALIVGAGIGGLAAGVALRRAGWTVRVFERATSPRELGFALLLAPNAISALRRLGLADRVIEGGARFAGGEIRRFDGRPLRSFDLGGIESLVPEPPVVVLRQVLHGALLDALGPDALTLDAEATGLEEAGGGVTLSLADGRRFDGDILVGADGIRSAIRARLHPDEPALRSSGLFAVRGVVHGASTPHPDRGIQYFGRGLEAAVAPAGGGAVYWYISLTGDYLASGPREALPVASRITANSDAWLRAIVQATREQDARLDELFVREPVPSWGRGRATLLGDAAHPMLPHAGQGAAQALEDAVTLGHVLATAPDSEEGLRRYERLRFDRTRRIANTARRNARAASLRNPLGCWLRDRLVRHVPTSVIANSYVAFGTPPELS
ncbi:MAG: FAD-dependent monooxygenase [Gemmatimonadales bacterium]